MQKQKRQESVGQEPAPAGAGQASGLPFPIIALGASAGGLAAFEQFFKHLPPGAENEMAFVLIQHLAPDYKSMLADIIQRFTPVIVKTAEDGMDVQVGHAYVIPPTQDLSISNGKLRLTQPTSSHGLRLPIDFFFRSLAQEQHELAVGIVLSGTGTDGTLGLKSIKEAGGLVIVQTPESAEFDGMPRSALATQLVDYVLPPNQMSERLLDYGRLAQQPGRISSLDADEQAEDILESIYHILQVRTGHDFSLYKRGMIARRIERRMEVHSIGDLRGYLSYLQQNPAEIDPLFNDLLIGVTSFLRNPEAFDLLKEKVIPKIIKSHNRQGSVRVWVPGCSTGEEAYTLAFLFRECMDELKQEVKVQIFATDIDAQAVAKARAGIYLENIALDVPAEQLDRFFVHEDNTYAVRKSIREMVVFAEHDLIENPPFSKLDLISCRNLLIYLGARLQKKLIPLFHYALNEDGYLFLGSAEGIGGFGDLFITLNRKWKLYQKKDGESFRRLVLDFSSPALGPVYTAAQGPGEIHEAKAEGRELVEKFLLAHHTPPCVLINEKLDILYFYGHTGAFLEHAPGEASTHLLRMARPGLRLELAALVRKASLEKVPARQEGLKFTTGADTRTVNLAVYPIERPENGTKLQLVVFQEVGSPVEAAGQAERGPDGSGPALANEKEAWAKEEYFQTVIEELEAANEELKSNNEEMQATNEELQSTNEELETAREEMQSVNEELNTVNNELQSKVEELSRVSNDMKNLLAATGIATLFLDTHLNILRYTPAATRLIHLIPGDVGRPVGDIVTSLKYDGLAQDALDVLDTLAMKEVETQTRNGEWYLVRILPYRTVENVIEGAVVTFVNITEQKQTQAELQTLAQQVQEEREFAENIIATMREPLIVLNEKLEVVSANRAYYQSFQTGPAETAGYPFDAISQKQWDIPGLLKKLSEIQASNQKSLDGFPVEQSLGDGKKRRWLVNARKVIRAAGKNLLILLTFEAISNGITSTGSQSEGRKDE